MKRIVPLIAFGTMILLNGSVFAAPTGAYSQVMQAVYTRDESTLKYLISVGLNINATNMHGKTALCTAVENQDYEGYELLLSQGATTRTPCMRDMNPETLARFQAEQPPLGTYYKGAVLTASRNGALSGVGKEVSSTVSGLPYPHIGEILLGGVAVGTAFAVGVHGSSGGGDDPDKKNDYVYTAPLNLDSKSFEDAEYSESAFSNGTNFLKKINASSAYARGYTGFKVSRNEKGELVPLNDGEGVTDVQKYITETKVKVAVMDNGQYYNTDLYNWNKDYTKEQDETTVYGLNYVYGVASSSSNPYWTYNSSTKVASLVKGTSVLSSLQFSDDPGGLTAQQQWNLYARQFAPVCQNESSTGCLKQDENYGFQGGKDANGYYRVYYKVNATDTPTTAENFYYIYPDMWTLYQNTYGETGYVYNPDNAFGGYFETKYTDLSLSPSSHGTHVAGIIAAMRNNTKMQGVAYNAEVIPVKLDLGMGESIKHIGDVITAYQDLKIMNLSIGPSDDNANYYISSDLSVTKDHWNSLGPSGYMTNSFAPAKENNVALIFSAGNGDKNNKGLPQSSIFSAAPLVDSGYKNLLINVVSLGNDNKITSYSNRCGATAKYCLAAPGGDYTNYIFSTGLSSTNPSGYTGMIGTSQAAPVVSGSLAVLMGAFPFLTTQQAVQILLDTANYITPTEDEITAYNALKPTGWEISVYKEETDASGRKYNSIYGRGLVDLNAATDPVGLPKISFDTTATSTNSVTAASSSAHISPLASNALKALPEKLIVLDDYSRPYQMSTKNFVRSEKRSDNFRRSFRSFMAQDEKVVDSSDTLSFAFSEAPKDKQNVQTGSMSMMMRPHKKIKMRLAFTQDTLSFGGSYVGRSQQNPFMNMRQAVGTDMGIQFAKNWALTGSWYFGKNGFIDEDIFDKMAHQSRMQLIESGIAYQGIKNVTLGISGGIMDEEDSLFGTRGAGAFKTNGAETRFVRVMANFQPTDKFRLSGAYTYGMTEANKTNTLMQFSKLTSDSFSLAAEYMPDEKQTFGVKLVSPLRIRSGSTSFNLPVARDLYEDRIYRETYTASLKPTAREYDLSLFYANEISSTLSWAGETGVRLNPDHKKDADTDYRALFKLNWVW